MEIIREYCDLCKKETNNLRDIVFKIQLEGPEQCIYSVCTSCFYAKMSEYDKKKRKIEEALENKIDDHY